MNYEQKYKEALERAKNLHKDAIDMGENIRAKQCEIIFPELKESEDEKIRKELITHCRNTRCVTEEGAERIAKWIAWLEKQGSNLVKNGYTDNKDIIKYADNYSHEIWRKLMDNFENIKDYHIGCNDVSDIVLNAIIDAYNWLEKQDGKYSGGTSKEWTISDAATLKELIDFLENGTAKLQHDLTRYANWLKVQFTQVEKKSE